MRIGGILDMSTVDYPGKVSSVVFFHGCNFRCPFCYNVSLVLGDDYQEIKPSDLVSSIKSHKGFIDAVVLTGGEPTIQPDLEELCRSIKNLKLLVKLDTNGYEPEKVKRLLEERLLDFISVDIKSSPLKYSSMAGVECNLSRIKETLDAIKDSGVDYEFRTTIVPGKNDTPEDIRAICAFIKPAKYVLQQFRPEGGTIGNIEVDKMDKDRLLELAFLAKKEGLNVKTRTEEDGERTIDLYSSESKLNSVP